MSNEMVNFDDIKKPVEAEYKLFQNSFEKAFETKNDLLKLVHSHILNKKGKQIRPLLTLLAAKSVGEINEKTIECAVSLEMLHTVSLIHDDIVDESLERRGQESVNAKWNNKIAVLSGDYLLSKSLSIAGKTKNLEVLERICNLGLELTEGELLQISNINNINCIEEKYIEVIKKKTATLFETCTVLGAISVNASEKEKETLRQFGEIYGICFQIKDDTFDYISSEDEIGKPVGIDIKEGKITLPLLYALKNNEEESKEYLNILRQKNFTTENTQKLIQFAIKNGGIEYANEKLLYYKGKALKILEDLKNEETKEALALIIQHTVERFR